MKKANTILILLIMSFSSMAFSYTNSSKQKTTDKNLQDTFKQYVGEYVLEDAGMIIEIYTKANDTKLFLFVDGQPEYELISTGEHKFSFKISDEYKIEFRNPENGFFKELVATQPDGTYTAIRKSILVNSQTIYSKAFGDSKDKALIFLHGGPGYNSVNFEATTAKKLSEKGFYVITYDRRGEGRSLDKKVNFTFEETLNDLNSLFDLYNLDSATLIGHSFGGIVATLFAEKFSEKIESLVYVGAPFSMQDTFSTIIKSSKTIYQVQKDSINLNYISMLEKMDKTTLQYSSYCFAHAMQNGFYRTKNLTKEAASIYKTFKTDSLLVKYSSQMTYAAPRGFWKNEKYTTIDLRLQLTELVKKNTPIFALYGEDDGLFSKEQVNSVKKIIGYNNLKYLSNCSHNVFIDQQTKFIDALIEWLKE